ncbi:serine/threonine protein phosphatase PrpC [Streptomyces sp. V4I23]|uniref:MerR family transcriptional regulator n=1 Tax=Streptomyces sp. V4I23 TaxID=3042282 RepID=UPI00277FD1FA|nr:MerR family transcriptional regulator [Streptomyces sp. V4I23]MDQ1009571.1 serine/threonine protein phosphatase PrpC [Streptomyces sp. V4I23]
MGLLTIGAFARASRLSARALRRYDELGLLPPARVDPFTGYRYYDDAQVERARLVAWLRRIGMPLAGVGRVCDLAETDTDAAAREIRAYWMQVESETSARRSLADLLVDQLSGKDTDMTDRITMPLGMRCAARTDRGLVRETDQDAVYAGTRLLAVADGFGGAGAAASAAAIGALEPLETAAQASSRAGDLLNTLEDAVHRAGTAVRAFPESGTTLTALLWTGSELALAHIGDTRAYLLRDGVLHRLTHDHTVVQSMIDEGGLDEAEAAAHPQRAMLLRALDAGDGPGRPDLRLHEAKAGDRFLLCSDGLSTTVSQAAVRDCLASDAAPEAAVDALIGLAHEGGGADNIAVVVADVVRT